MRTFWADAPGNIALPHKKIADSSVTGPALSRHQVTAKHQAGVDWKKTI